MKLEVLNHLISKRLYVFLILYSLSYTLQADTILCPIDTNKIRINQSIAYYIDTTFRLTLDDVLQHDSIFNNEIHSKTVASRERQKGIIWGHFSLKNTSAQPLTYLLQIDDAFLNTLHFYTFSDDLTTLIFTDQSGINLPFDIRQVKYRKPTEVIEIPANELIHIYFRADKYAKAVRLNMDLWTISAFVGQQTANNFMFGLFYGFALLILFFAIVVYLLFRDTFMIGYCFYILGSLLFALANSGLLFQYFLDGANPILVEQTRPWILFIGFSGLLYFVHYFFNEPVIFPRLNTARLWFHGLYTTLFFIGSPIYYFLPKSEWIWYITLFSTSGSFLCLVIVVISFLIVYKAYRQNKTTEALLLFIVYLVMFFYLGSFIVNVYFYQLFTLPPVIADNVSLLFLIIESLLMSVAIAFRINRMIKNREELRLEVEKQKLELANSLIKGAENERERIAKDLHDSIGSYLSTIGIYTDQLREKEGLKNQIRSLVNETHREVRRISDDLLPMAFNRFGLIEAIKTLCENLDAAHSLSIQFITNIQHLRLSNTQQLNIYRIIQELTNNTVKHANATQLTVQLLQDEEGLALTVEDNGKGFDINEAKNRKTTAFHSIQSRCASLNAQLHIESQISRGTMIIIEITSS